MLRRAVGFQTSTSTEDDPDPTSDGKTANNDIDEDDEDNGPNAAYPSLPSELDNELLDASKCRIYFRCLAKLLISCSNKQKSFLGAHPGNLREAIKQMTVDIDVAFGERRGFFTSGEMAKVSSSLTRFFYRPITIWGGGKCPFSSPQNQGSKY